MTTYIYLDMYQPWEHIIADRRKVAGKWDREKAARNVKGKPGSREDKKEGSGEQCPKILFFKERQTVFASWVKDSYTERFLLLLSCTHKLGPMLVQF
jgi:hypothetical protein